MDTYKLLLFAAKTLDEMNVRYLVTGSIATMTYGESRFTNDIDIVADLKLEHVDPICKAFASPEYYCSAAAVTDAINRRFQFNVIQPDTGLKIDFMVPVDDPFNESRLARGRLIEFDDEGNSARFASAEDAILKSWNTTAKVAQTNICAIFGVCLLFKAMPLILNICNAGRNI